MTSERLLDYIGQIDDSIIVEADAPLTTSKLSRRTWIRWASLGAVVAACLLIVIPLWLQQTRGNSPIDPFEPSNPTVNAEQEPSGSANSSDHNASELPDNDPEREDRPLPATDPSDLPKLAVNTELGTYGFEGYLAYDVSELQNGNPWTEDNHLTTLPVFTNPNEYDRAGAPVGGLSAQEMLAEVEKVAHLLGLKIASLHTEPALEQHQDIYIATGECNGAEVEVQKDGHVLLTLTPDKAHLAKEIGKLSDYNRFTISFEYLYKAVGGALDSRGLPLPGGYSFTYGASHEQALEITQYLLSEYGAFMGISTPGYDLAADYTYDGVLTRLHTFVFDNAGSLTERILNYNFNRLYFAATESGDLGAISYYNPDLSQKIGDYPIITAAEARQLLLENHYITSVPEAFPGEEYIAHVELMYRTGRLDTIFMPYYKFLVEMPTMELENGLKTFGVFYVPAVQSEFLENLPVWDGSFN
jgi:hypothetical protein